ncbi:MAG TPA: membrane protein insertion efficiency factor YidD [Candidatus Binatia bacterium]
MYRVCRNIIPVILSAYHKLLSPFLPRSCRFFPSCSVYASEAIQKHGILRGLSLGLKRVSRCHAGNPGGYDPVH